MRAFQLGHKRLLFSLGSGDSDLDLVLFQLALSPPDSVCVCLSIRAEHNDMVQMLLVSSAECFNHLHATLLSTHFNGILDSGGVTISVIMKTRRLY